MRALAPRRSSRRTARRRGVGRYCAYRSRTSSGIGMNRSAVLTDCRASDNGCWRSAPAPAALSSSANRDLDTAEVTYCGRSCRMLNQWVGSCESRATRFSAMCGLQARLTVAEIGADGIHAGKVLWQEVSVVHSDPEPLFQEDHQPEQPERVEDAAVQQWCVIRQRQQCRVRDEFLTHVVLDDLFHSSTLLPRVCLLALNSGGRPRPVPARAVPAPGLPCRPCRSRFSAVPRETRCSPAPCSSAATGGSVPARPRGSDRPRR